MLISALWLTRISYLYTHIDRYNFLVPLRNHPCLAIFVYGDRWLKDFITRRRQSLHQSRILDASWSWTHARTIRMCTREIYRRAITSIMTCGNVLCSDYRSILLEIRVGSCKSAMQDMRYVIGGKLLKLIFSYQRWQSEFSIKFNVKRMQMNCLF